MKPEMKSANDIVNELQKWNIHLIAMGHHTDLRWLSSTSEIFL